MPRTLDDIAGSGNVERGILSRDLRTIIKKIKLNLNQYNTTSLISNNMSLKEKIKRDAFEILRHGHKQITARKHPVVQAAASLYIAYIINGEKSVKRNFQ